MRIVIIGANFAGLMTALNLSGNYHVSIIDSQPQFEFLPNIHELVSGVKKPNSLRIDRKRLIKRAGHRFIEDKVTSIDPVKKKIYTSNRKRIPYDICVVAVGGVNNASGIAGAVKFGLPFKSVEQCQDIGRRLKTLSRRKHPPAVVILGGGLEGVEALGEILRRYRRHPGLEIHLIEKKNNLLADRPRALDRDIRKICEPYNVNFHLDTRITKITNDKVWLSSRKTLKSSVVICTGGAIPPSLLYKSSLAKHPKSWAPVNGFLQSKYFESIFIVGDAAELPGGPTSKQAYHAMDMGECVAQNIKLLSAGDELKKYYPSSKPTVVSFGDLQTYVILGNIAVAGPLFAGAKEAIFQATMARLDPPYGLSSAWDLYNRTSESLFNVAVPALTSFSSLRRLANIRFLGG